ncbi:MAG: heme exporter protein CcmB [Acidobacteria bacterium]|jgi:heme exporter protein B|nr:heme exporter protein CcmB [Acidobacteriota bacterium]
MRELMLPMLLLPLTIPVLIAAIESTTILLRGLPMREAELWIKLLAGFDVIFTVLAWLLFDSVVQE